MEQITVKNLTLRFSKNINYSWALFGDYTSVQDFITSLNDVAFGEALKENCTKNLLLDCTRIGNFSVPEMSDYLNKDFAEAMVAEGIQKISVVVDENAMGILQFIFTAIEQAHADSVPQIKFFNQHQFHETWESVSWF